MKCRWLCVVLISLCSHIARAQQPDNRPLRGNAETAPDPGQSAQGLSDAEAQAAFYRPDEVQTIRLQVAEQDLKSLQAALPARIYVPATFQWRDVSVGNVAIRYKGNSSSNPDQPFKRSFLIRFDKDDPDARFFGLRRVSFDNGIQFGSLFSEPIITGILRDHGITTHRCNYARITLNGEYKGVYVNVERIDESFIEQHLPDVNGALFKVDEGGPGCNLQFLGDNPSIYKKTFEAKSKSAKKARVRLVEFIRMINQSQASDFAAKLEAAMDVDDFLRVAAVMLFSGAFDQLTGWGPHNYYLYHDAARGRWRYLPWDLDVGFCETAFGRVPVLDAWHAAWPVAPSGRPNPLMERIVDDPVLLKRYRQVARTILEQSFEPERLCGIIDANYALIKDDLRSDPFPHRRVTNPGDRDYDGIVASIKTFVRKRYASAVEQLENPGPRPKIENRSPHGLPPRLAEKLRRIEHRARLMQKQGQDVSPIQKLLQQVPPLIQQGRFDDAEKVFDEVLQLIGEKPGAPGKEPRGGGA